MSEKNIKQWFDGKNDPISKIETRKDMYDFAECILYEMTKDNDSRDSCPDIIAAEKSLMLALLFKYENGTLEDVISELNKMTALAYNDEDDYVNENYKDSRSRYNMILTLRSTDMELGCLASILLGWFNKFMDLYGPEVRIPFEEIEDDDEEENTGKQVQRLSAEDIISASLAMEMLEAFGVGEAKRAKAEGKKVILSSKGSKKNIEYTKCDIFSMRDEIIFTPVKIIE